MDATALIEIAIGLALIMAAAWVIQQVSKSSGAVDSLWTFGVGLGGIAAVLLPGDGVEGRRVVVGILVVIWSLRLGLHVAKRNAGLSDDPRYAALTKEWGDKAALYMFIFLEIQAVAAFVLVLAVRLAGTNASPFPSPQDVAGIVLLVVSIAGESVADAQLAAFGKAHKGEKAVCDVGLWKWSRHPNYFFEWLGWVAWAVIAIAPAQPWSFAALGAPALMYYLLVYASGIPPLEKHMLETRGDRFRAYRARVNAFFPGPNRSPKELS